MDAIHQDLLSEDPAIGVGPWYGYFSRDVLDIADFAYVILPEFDAHFEWGPCYWMARDATTLPVKGNKCLMTLDNRRNPWVTAWFPF